MRKLALCFVLAPLLAAACDSSEGSDAESGAGGVSSNEVDLTTFEFDGEVLTDDATRPRQAIGAQMFYFVGALYPLKANARLDWFETSNLETTEDASGLSRIRYHVKIPVAWNKSVPRPETFDLVFPRRMDEPGQRAFYQKYKGVCSGSHDYGSDEYWHDFDANRAGCVADDADVIRSRATVTLSTTNTKGVYPEYDRVWGTDSVDKEGAFEIVAIFGPNVSASASDVGVQDYNTFVRSLRDAVPGATVTPAFDTNPGPDVREVTIEGVIADGGKVKATVMLQNGLERTTAEWDAHYAELTKTADFITYSGHSGLSKNVRALATKGTITPGHYQIFFWAGCNTFAYLDKTIYERVAAANAPNDPLGTKNMDVIGTVLPSYFGANPGAVMRAVRAILNRAEPKTFNEMFDGMPARHQTIVAGEEDNVFRP